MAYLYLVQSVVNLTFSVKLCIWLVINMLDVCYPMLLISIYTLL